MRDLARYISLLTFLATPVVAQETRLDLVVEVIDGDTLRIVNSGEKIRLLGIDACETGQKAITSSGQIFDCGVPATSALIGLTKNRTLSCRVNGRDRYKRILATCGRMETPDIGAELVKRGLAVVYRYKGKATMPEYVAIEKQARASRLGLWDLSFDDPSSYRRTRNGR